MIAFLFPGQGSQFTSFLHTLGGASPHARIDATFEEASDVLRMNVLDLDSVVALKSTVAVQLGLFIAGVATARALREEGIVPDAVAGLSVGAYGAAVAADAIDFNDALLLLQLRAQLMERAYPHGYGMLAVSGLSEREVDALIARTNAKAAFIANLNAPRQIVVAGADGDLDLVRQQALQAGARKAERLAVSVPSHCVLLDDAARELTEAASKVEFRTPSIPYIGNRGARPLRQADAVRLDLATNLRYPVRWHDSTVVLSELGAQVFVEMPPGRTLTQLADEALPGIAKVAVEQTPMTTSAALIKARAVD
ncbi:MAG: malonate decarboxylase subunit epsilon [Pseudomonadota bacterium]|uniref:Malonyl CoA-acyl carrier protein transacylase n=1 Tax=Caballeronia sordidicola TaxID=196367 RepID=A0A242MB13_CABSO|nr:MULTISPECIES: malonate decarboxylase subunit epsilon [Burkholderiaceae]AMH44080.1 malonate decarboxylase subunit epsilon [Burkholderia sp. PAMC 26561]MDP9157535.1 malonate decarboxylase subunit epsilon [Pseudomonadota bacterium]OTP68487.1 Malonyl CoA acyl carrier protein transacylase [Caballeronia sordidicola]